jgi:hypothetical protein
MQYIFNVKEGIHEYIKLSRNYSFPSPPIKRCHNPECNRIVHFRKHGFYERYFYSREYRGKIVIRRYICLCFIEQAYIRLAVARLLTRRGIPLDAEYIASIAV